MFNAYKLFTEAEFMQVADLRAANREECPQFFDKKLAAVILGRLLRRACAAVDEGLVDDPIHVGVIYGALLEAASEMCGNTNDAEIYIENWREYDCPELVSFMERKAKSK